MNKETDHRKKEEEKTYIRRLNTNIGGTEEKKVEFEKPMATVLGRRDSQNMQEILQKLKSRRSFMIADRPILPPKKTPSELKEEANKVCP